jgi:DNA-binding NtrC family response regulator
LLTPARASKLSSSLGGCKDQIVEEQPSAIRVLAVVSDEMRAALARKLAGLNVEIERVTKAAEIARIVGNGDSFDVAILPATLPNAEWLALWGELCLLNPRPSILVYARAATFELWTSVLDLGGFDVIVEPFSDREIQEAVLLAAQSFRDKRMNDAEQC